MRVRPDAPLRFPADLYRSYAMYNRWMNERVYEASAGLSDEQRKRDLGAFFRSVHLTLNHLLLTDRAWLARFDCPREVWRSVDADGNVIRISGLDAEVYSDFATLRRERAHTDADIERFAEGLDGDRLGAPFEYVTSKGERWRHPLWWALSHFFNHQTHHRGQITTLLKQLGVDPGVTDFVALLREGYAEGES